MGRGRGFQTVAFYAIEGRDKEYQRLKEKGFDMGRCWSVERGEEFKTLYCFQYRFPKDYPHFKLFRR